MAVDNTFNPRSLGQFVNSVVNNPLNIISNRAPGTADRAPIGQVWINKATNSVYTLTSITSGQSNWTTSANSGAGTFTTVTISGGAGTVLDVQDGNVVVEDGNLTLSNGNLNVSGDVDFDSTSIDMLVGAGDFTLDGAAASDITIGTSLVAGTISIGGTAQTGDIVLGSSSAVQTVKIADGTGAGNTHIAFNQTGGNVDIGTSMTSGIIGIGNNAGTLETNIASGSGELNLVTSSNVAFIQTTGTARFYVGTGAPNNALAIEAGDLYVRSDPAGATSRLYIATGANTWTNVTCAA